MRHFKRGGTAWDLSVVTGKAAPYLLMMAIQVVLCGSLAAAALVGLMFLSRFGDHREVASWVLVLPMGGCLWGVILLTGRLSAYRREWSVSSRDEMKRLAYSVPRWLRMRSGDD